MKVRKDEVVELLEILINDLQMLELDDSRYGEAFQNAMALQAYVLSINNTGLPPASSSEAYVQ